MRPDVKNLRRWFAPFAAVVVALAMAGLLASCHKKPQVGYLRLSGEGEGSYDIYRIASESPLQFVSEQAGRLNEDIALAPGSYLVLADCSSETVIIYPGERETLIAHRLVFMPPRPPSKDDGFSIQCNRSDNTRSRQHVSNRYELNLIHGKRDLLVGMVPLHIDFAQRPGTDRPTTHTYRLAALQVADFEARTDEATYFVSPVDELIAATSYQRFGRWEFLLPGAYMVEVNGTRMQVQLGEGGERIVRPAILRVTTSPEIDLDQPVRVKGNPWLVEINAGHWLNFNEYYPVLPGTATLAIGGSTQSVEVAFSEGETKNLVARSITVDQGCPPSDVTCPGDKDVSVYRAGEPYPFLESVSDMPILFIDEQQPVLVGIEGSRDITYEVPGHQRDKTLHLGYARILPSPQHRPGQVSDLIRIDPAGPPLAGHTLDLSMERPSLVPLAAGHYHLAHYLSMTTTEGDRRLTNRAFTIEPGKTVDIEVQVFLNEKRYLAYRKKQERLEKKAAAEATTKAATAPTPAAAGSRVR